MIRHGFDDLTYLGPELSHARGECIVARQVGPHVMAFRKNPLAQEYRVGLRFLSAPDFREGIRAQVVDKDRNPRWKPPTLAEVEPGLVDRFFEPLGSRELDLNSVDLQLKEPDHA